ncbi:MAG: SDR family oxidoreductase [Thaumarchaeota archaeon]|nr:SDR family oxidoreductase [Nitrososphaerota archaeon]
MELEGKVALVTGGNSGIGRAVAELFAREKAKVVIADIKRGETARAIEQQGGVATFIPADVRDDSRVKRLVDGCVKKYGTLDIVCNNAGIELVGPLVETTEEEWDRVVDTNLNSVFLVSRHALPYMIKKRKGVIVNIASQLGIVAMENLAAYSATKAGVILLTKAMALEHAKDGIRVNCVCPGAIDTPLTDRILRHQQDPKKGRKTLIAKHPIGRLGRPEEIAQAVLFLASERSSFATGAALVVDGGYSIC